MGFIILDFDVNSKVPFIFGCPFLETRNLLIDVGARQFTIHAHDKVEVFDVYEPMNFLAVYKIDGSLSHYYYPSNDG